MLVLLLAHVDQKRLAAVEPGLHGGRINLA
jgi:hypothetical protein